MKRSEAATELGILSALLIAFLILLLLGVMTPAKAESSAPTWDYGELIYVSTAGTVTWVEVDDAGRADVQTAVDAFQSGMIKAHVKAKDIPSIYYLNIAGRFGWELVTERDESDGSLYTFKKVR